MFTRLEHQVTDINLNVNLLMGALSNKVGIFGEEWGSTAGDNLEGGSRDWDEMDNQPKKKPRKDQPSSSVINQSQHLFKMEAKVDIKSYHGKINALKLNHWLQQLEVYFSVDQIEEEQKISFVRAKIRGPYLDLVGKPHGDLKVGGRTSSD